MIVLLSPVSRGGIVLAGSPAISVSPSSASSSLPASGTDVVSFTLTRSGGFTGTVTPSVAGLPTGVTASFSPTTFGAGVTAMTMTLTSSSAHDITNDAYTVTFSGSGVSDAVFNGTVTVSGSAVHSIFTNAPGSGWTTVFDFGNWTEVPPTSGDANNFATIERTGQGTVNTNLSIGTDASQPGGGSTPGYIRTTFPTSLPGGFAPAVWLYSGSWPAGTKEIFVGYTQRFSSNWQDANTGTKHFFWGDGDNNHYCGGDRGSYPNPGGGTSSNMGWIIGPQAPTGYAAWSNITPFPRNAWNKIEFQVNYGTAGSSNGTVKAWFNGNPVNFAPYTWYEGSNFTGGTQLTTINWANSGQSINMNRFQWEPTYGGGLTSPPTSMSQDIGHVYCRVK